MMFTTARISKTNPWNWCHVGVSNVLLNCLCSNGCVSPLLLTVQMCIICRPFTFVTTKTLKYLHTSDMAPFPRPNVKWCQVWVYEALLQLRVEYKRTASIGIGASLAFCLEISGNKGAGRRHNDLQVCAYKHSITCWNRSWCYAESTQRTSRA